MTQTQQMAAVDLLARDAIALAGDSSRGILGVAGCPGAGKSTFVEQLLVRIRAVVGDEWVAHVPMDGFHLADAQLDRIGARNRKGAPETFDAAGYAHLLERVRRESDDPIYVPGFDRVLEQPLAAALVVLPSARLVARHIEFGKTPADARTWVATTDQRNSELVAGTAGRADRIILNGAAGWGLG